MSLPKGDSPALNAACRLELYETVRRGIDSAFKWVRPTQGSDREAETYRLLFEASVALSQLASSEAESDA